MVSSVSSQSEDPGLNLFWTFLQIWLYRMSEYEKKLHPFFLKYPIPNCLWKSAVLSQREAQVHFRLQKHNIPQLAYHIAIISCDKTVLTSSHAPVSPSSPLVPGSPISPFGPLRPGGPTSPCRKSDRMQKSNQTDVKPLEGRFFSFILM